MKKNAKQVPGSDRPAQASAKRQRAETELVAINRVLAAEIAQREQAEARRQASEERFRVLFETSSDAIMTLEPPAWRFTSGNPATVKMFQAQDEAQFVRQSPWEFSPPCQPDGTRSPDKAKAMIERAMQEGSHFFEWEHRRADGEIFPATILLTRVTLGEAVFLQATVRDITESKRVEQELKIAAEQWDATFNSIADLVSVQDANHRLVRVNQAYATAFGRPPEQLIGRPCYEIVHGRTDPWLDCPCSRVLATKQPARVDLFEPTLGAHLEISASPLLDAGGAVVGCVHIAKDITARKQAEQRQAELLARLAEINQELKNFAYVVSHDLKAPLRAIKTLADWLATDYRDRLDAQGQENLQLLGSRVDRMQSLIDGILQYSRVGHAEQTAVPVPLDQLVPEVIENLGAPAHISIRIETELPTVAGDPTRITQVFQNLLSNAIKYRDKPRGDIGVGCVAQDGFWKFRVRDNGPGIDPGHFERIFQLFQTLGPREDGESTGIGLAITKKIVEMYGGRIWVESELGRGSTFFFTFPQRIV
jgi:two-component system, LuxR family, sensor kinase FixL